MNHIQFDVFNNGEILLFSIVIHSTPDKKIIIHKHRYSTVQKTLLKDNQVFTFEDGSDNQQMFGLVTNDLTQIRPNYEAMVKGGTLRITDEGYAQGKLGVLFFCLCFTKYLYDEY